MSALFYNTELCDSLYPRQYGKSLDDIIQIIGKKIHLNVFGFENNVLVIGNIVSKFNHSCHPNCRMDIVDKVNNDRFYGIWTHKKIEKGMELCIDYVNGGSIEYHNKMNQLLGTNCLCTPEYILKNIKRSRIMMDLASTYRKNMEIYIHQMVDLYLSSKRGRDALEKNLHAKKHATHFVTKGLPS